MIPSHEADLSSESQGGKRGYSQLRDEAEERRHLYAYGVVCTLLREGCQINWKKSKGATRDLKLVMMELTPSVGGVQGICKLEKVESP